MRCGLDHVQHLTDEIIKVVFTNRASGNQGQAIQSNIFGSIYNQGQTIQFRHNLPLILYIYGVIR